MQEYPQPEGGASLVLAFRLNTCTTLVLGSGPLAASRAFAALEADSKVVVLAKGILENACDEIQWRSAQGQLAYVDWDTLPASSSSAGEQRDIESLESYLSSGSVRFVCITDTLSTSTPQKRTRSFAQNIYLACKLRNIPVNTTDIPDLCDFTFTATHRFDDPQTGKKTPLQVGVTTNGHGCRLAGRIRRDIVAKLPKNVGTAVERVGRMRMLAKSSASPTKNVTLPTTGVLEDEADELDEDSGVMTPNGPVPSRTASTTSSSLSPGAISAYTETEVESTKRKIKWVAQVSEYWSVSRLAQMTDDEMAQILSEELNPTATTHPSARPDSPPAPAPVGLPPPLQHFPDLSPRSIPSTKQGHLILIGSGPGHPSLLTLAARTALTQLADLVLSDKLVPEAVLALIPAHVPIKIARKFPGNADGAQEEMMREAVEAVKNGLCVVRLKQGDPQIYARTAEEVLYFRQHLTKPRITIVPGISSALAGPTYASIFLTQRGVAESFVVCTGVGRGGKDVKLPGYERGRTTVILMGVARLKSVVGALLETPEATGSGSDGKGATKRRSGPAYPPHLPIAIVERASMPDQRVVTSTLRDILSAMQSVGEQRPPGMIVVGWAVLGVWATGEVGERLLDDAEVVESGEVDKKPKSLEDKDEERGKKWLEGKRWRVEEGIENGGAWEELEEALQDQKQDQISRDEVTVSPVLT